MAVSILALMVAIGGTAVANLSKKEKKQTRNITTKQINKLAPGLSVASAQNAANATNATNAGFAAATNIRSASSSGVDINITGNGGNQDILTVQINAPVAGRLLINGGLHVDPTVVDVYSCDLLLDGALRGAASRQHETTATTDQSCETSDGATVAAGNHTVVLRSSGVNASNEIEDASLQVLFVP